MTENNIASERKRVRMTQKDLGDFLGVDTSTIRRWESGENVPSSKAIDMSEKFGCTTDYLFGRAEERKPIKTAV
jgi:DNA-binding XRE family transcriptional regulator